MTFLLTVKVVFDFRIFPLFLMTLKVFIPLFAFKTYFNINFYCIKKTGKNIINVEVLKSIYFDLTTRQSLNQVFP